MIDSWTKLELIPAKNTDKPLMISFSENNVNGLEINEFSRDWVDFYWIGWEVELSLRSHIIFAPVPGY